jgi:tetratricopeptide (TPR) repeat protein
MQLATFRGGFFAVEAQALLGMGAQRLEPLLHELCHRNWLTSFTADGRVRYTLRNVASREYAWEQLTAPPPQPAALEQPAELYRRALRAHARCFAELVAREGEKLKGAPGSGQTAALHRLKLLEKENILAALETALECDDLDSLLLLAPHLGRLMEMTSEFSLLRETAERLLTAAHDLRSPRLELCAQGGRAAAAFRTGDLDQAQSAAQRVGELADQLQDASAAADALRVQGLIAYTRGDYPQALELLRAGLERLADQPDVVCEAGLLNNLANAEVPLREWAAARQHFERCLELRRAGGDRYGEAMVLNNLGNLDLREQRTDDGVARLEQCLAIRREICDLHGQAATFGNLGIANYVRGEVDTARTNFRQALAIQRSLGDRLGMAGTLNNLGAVERAQRDFATARPLYQQAVTLSRELSYGLAEATALLNLGNAEAALGNQAAAVEAYGSALPLLLQLGGLSLLPKTVALAGAQLARRGCWPAAVAALHGGVQRCPELQCQVEPDEQELLDQAWQQVSRAIDAGALSSVEVDAARARGAALELAELTRATHAALTAPA